MQYCWSAHGLTGQLSGLGKQPVSTVETLVLLPGRRIFQKNELISRQGIERFQIMGHETEVRGEQAGGGLVPATDSSGHVRFVGHKVVNNKRKNLTYHLESGFARKRQQAIRAGYRPLGTSSTAAWHYRFGTSGPPSVLETHWHERCPARIDRVWQQINGRWTVKRKNINHRITHNGDFDGFLLFDKLVDYEKLGFC